MRSGRQKSTNDDIRGSDMTDESSHRRRHTRYWFPAVSRNAGQHQIRIIVKSSAYDSSPISIALIICRSFVAPSDSHRFLPLQWTAWFSFLLSNPYPWSPSNGSSDECLSSLFRLIAHFSENKNFWKYFLTISLKIFKIIKIENQCLKPKLMNKKHLICSTSQKHWIGGQ